MNCVIGNNVKPDGNEEMTWLSKTPFFSISIRVVRRIIMIAGCITVFERWIVELWIQMILKPNYSFYDDRKSINNEMGYEDEQ
jgi:hypothetical protein